MNRMLHFAGLILATCAVAGCLPEKRINWSHDGSRAAVSSDKGVFFIDANGKVLPPRLPDVFARCLWFKDDQRLLIVHPVHAKGWDDVAPLFAPRQVEAMKSYAEDVRRRALVYEGDWDKFDFDEAKRFSPGEATAILLYIRDKASEGLREKLGEKWKDIEKADASIWQIQIFKCTDARLEPGDVLFRSLDEIRQPTLAPNEKTAAFLMSAPGSAESAISLFVLPLETNSKARQVAPHVAYGYDWSPDARNLAYINAAGAPKDESAVQLGTLSTISVADDKGQLLKEFAQRTDRVGLLFNEMLQVAWLTDGRLIFSSAPVTLPATTRQMPQGWSLFVLDLRTPAGVSRALGSELHDFQAPGMPLFEVSPDNRRVLIPGPKGQWRIFDFASGDGTTVSKLPGGDEDVRSLACWMNNSEICLVVPGETGTTTAPEKLSRYEVAVWKGGQTRIMSAEWPDEMREWLRGR